VGSGKTHKDRGPSRFGGGENSIWAKYCLSPAVAQGGQRLDRRRLRTVAGQ
jgi:hypothetical protein